MRVDGGLQELEYKIWVGSNEEQRARYKVQEEEMLLSRAASEMSARKFSSSLAALGVVSNLTVYTPSFESYH